MQNLADIGKVIKNKRLSLNLRMDVVALKCGITRATLSLIENGKGNCSINTYLKLSEILGLSLKVNDVSESKNKRERAARLNSALDKKTNRFVIMCIELYSHAVKKSSRYIYNEMNKKGVIQNLTDGYEDLHGMSFEYLNDYIGMLLRN